jgi:hypothetical protein
MLNVIVLGVCIVLAAGLFIACYSIRSEAATRRRGDGEDKGEGEDGMEPFADLDPYKCDVTTPRSFGTGSAQCKSYTSKGTVPFRYMNGFWLVGDDVENKIDVSVCKNDGQCTSTADTLDKWQKEIQNPITAMKNKLVDTQTDITDQEGVHAEQNITYAYVTNKLPPLKKSYRENIDAVTAAMNELKDSLSKDFKTLKSDNALSKEECHDIATYQYGDSSVRSVNSDNIPYGCLRLNDRTIFNNANKNAIKMNLLPEARQLSRDSWLTEFGAGAEKQPVRRHVEWSSHPGTYFSGYAYTDGNTYTYDSLTAAKVACAFNDGCRGITQEDGGKYATRAGNVFHSSSVTPHHQKTWKKNAHTGGADSGAGARMPVVAKKKCYGQGRCNSGYMLKDKYPTWWSCGKGCKGGKYLTDVSCNCSCIPADECEKK